MRTFFILAVCALLMICAVSRATELFVPPDGDDANPGTRAAPLKTLEASRDAIRKLATGQQALSGGVTVWLREG